MAERSREGVCALLADWGRAALREFSLILREPAVHQVMEPRVLVLSKLHFVFGVSEESVWCLGFGIETLNHPLPWISHPVAPLPFNAHKR